MILVIFVKLTAQNVSGIFYFFLPLSLSLSLSSSLSPFRPNSHQKRNNNFKKWVGKCKAALRHVRSGHKISDTCIFESKSNSENLILPITSDNDNSVILIIHIIIYVDGINNTIISIIVRAVITFCFFQI